MRAMYVPFESAEQITARVEEENADWLSHAEKPDPEELFPVNPPVYSKLKELYLTTTLIDDGKAAISIMVPEDGCYQRQSLQIQKAVSQISGVEIPIIKDRDVLKKNAFFNNLILLGNRSTNAKISDLYDQFYTLLDLKYPGPGGYVVRTLHNPLGDGRNMIFLGGSDSEGVAAATEAFCRILSQQSKKSGDLAVGWLGEIQLGRGIDLPQNISEVKTWEDSSMYRSEGYFGWNMISEHMALYYMTGDEIHAREALRLCFPDETAKQDITDIDGELIENKDDPLAGPYHYGALMLILFWDLIEESPVFGDADRLWITNAFSRQLAHPQEFKWREEVYQSYGQGKNAFKGLPESFGERHQCWSHLNLYALSRYFQKDYPEPVWKHCLDGANWYFSPLKQQCHMLRLHGTWKAWYSSYVAPVISYIILSGNRDAITSGALSRFLLGQEIIISGKGADSQKQKEGAETDDALKSASIEYLHKAAYLTGDGRFLEYLCRSGMDLDTFRIGQSFWPEDSLTPASPDDLVGRWTLLPMPKSMWHQRQSPAPLNESFLSGSFRNSVDDSGDFLIFDTFRDKWERYHTFDIASLRIKGRSILDFGENHLFARIDGLAPPEVSQDTAVSDAYVLGGHALIQANVAKAGAAQWQRSVLLRDSRFALVVDHVKFPDDSNNGEVMWLWQGQGDWKDLPDQGAIETQYQNSIWDIRHGDNLEITVSKSKGNSNHGRMVWRGDVKKDQALTYFSLIAENVSGGEISCKRLDDQTAMLQLPSVGLVTAGGCMGISGELVLITENVLQGKAIDKIDPGELLFESSSPVHCDWDFEKGVIAIKAAVDTQVWCNLKSSDELLVDGSATTATEARNGLTALEVSAGKSIIEGAKPGTRALQALGSFLRQQRAAVTEPPNIQPKVPATKQQTFAKLSVAGSVSTMITVPDNDETRICAAVDKQVYVWSPTSGQSQILQAESKVQALHHWAEQQLLLVGCKNAEVIAFDLDSGQRRWTFMSEMDPAVLQAGKPYWYRSAKGHEGIHGLYSGIFYEGKTQAFIGSACTLEIIDEQGQLLRRLPVFWGPGCVFALVNAPDGSINLLVSRRPADTQAAVVVNNRQEYVPNMLGPDPFSFHDVPAGHSDISAWGKMVRNTIFYDDIDFDGRKEVVSDIEGAWNRITVWTNDAQPLYNANIGPGPLIQLKTKGTIMRGLALASLDGSDKKAILAAAADGWVVALSHRCQAIWARHLNFTPVTLRTVNVDGEVRIVIACQENVLSILDREGNWVGNIELSGRPICMEPCSPGVVIGTENGVLEAVQIHEIR